MPSPNMTQPQQSVSRTATISGGVNTSDIQALTIRAQVLSQSVDRWNAGMIWALVFAALAVVAVVATTFVALQRAKELGDTQAELLKAKDAQIASDLAEKDVRISEAGERAAKANDRAGEAELGAAEAQRGTAIAQVNAARANQQAAEANRSAEQERIERLKLEAQVAPRRLTREQQEDIAKACIHFRGHTVAVSSYSLDAEGAILAKQVIASLQASGMQVQDATASISPIGSFSLGIHVTGQDLALTDGLRQILSSVGHLAVAPADAEAAKGWEMSTGPRDQTELSILVGVKPIK